jgi:hypothetical protein
MLMKNAASTMPSVIMNVSPAALLANGSRDG